MLLMFAGLSPLYKASYHTEQYDTYRNIHRLGNKKTNLQLQQSAIMSSMSLNIAKIATLLDPHGTCLENSSWSYFEH